MDAVEGHNETGDGEGDANHNVRVPEVQPQHHNNNNNNDDSTDETFFDYSDIEEGDDDDEQVEDDDDDDGNDDVQENHNDGNEQIDNHLLRDTTVSRPHRLSHDFETTALDRHIQRMDWPAVLRRIKIYPQECCTVDVTNGQTPLHVACHAGAPAVIIQSLCQAYPEASIRTDRCNMNPLHITCSSNSASLNTVHALLNHGSSEQISMRDVDGDTPLHAACRCGANKDVIDFLLQAYPGAVHVRDYEGFTPLVRLWVRYYVILGETEIYNAIESPSNLENDIRFLTAWDQTLLLLRYAYHGNGNMSSTTPSSSSSSSSAVSSTTQPTSIYATSTSFRQQIQSSAQRLLSPPRNTNTMNSMLELQSDQDSSFVLHAVSAVDCPRFVVQLAIRKYPTQLFQRDTHGRSPLMIACAAPIYPYHNLSDDMSWTHGNIDNDDDDGGSATDHDEEEVRVPQGNGIEHDQNSTTVRIREDNNETLPNAHESKLSVIELILQSSKALGEMIQLPPEQKEKLKYGGADWLDPSGRLPLHIAIDSGKTWNDGIDALIKMYPESISITDRSTKLFPYQLAATKVIQNDSTMNDCYQLLRLNPTVLCMNQSGPSRRDDISLSQGTTNPTAVESITNGVADFGPQATNITTNDSFTYSTNNERDDSIQRKRRKL